MERTIRQKGHWGLFEGLLVIDDLICSRFSGAACEDGFEG